MQRKSKKGLKTYIKRHGGTHFFADGTTVKRGETVELHPEDITDGIKDVFELIETVKEDKTTPDIKSDYYRLEKVEKGLFNILDKQDKVLNVSPLSKKLAKEFMDNI